MARNSPRRAPGLRREELALLAGISIDYVIRLEQGRARTPSAQVCASLARRCSSPTPSRRTSSGWPGTPTASRGCRA
jgi:transcriptional regulator with XRE-family HTH domain